jgi:hypothetical protein
MSLLIAAFEFTSPPGVSKPFAVKRACLESMKKNQGASYFYLMERPKFSAEIKVSELVRGGYLEEKFCCGYSGESRDGLAREGAEDYAITYKRSGGEINYIDVVCVWHGHLSRQGDSDRDKGLPEGFVDNYLARVKTRFDMYK